jgi:hypothetical protein
MARGQRKVPEELEPTSKPLRDEVREALLTILRDEAASAAAKASAARTLLEYFSEQRPLGEQSADTLSEDELDAEIARLKA